MMAARTIRAVLVDDEPPARVRLRQLLVEAGGVSVVGEAGSAEEARAVIRDTAPDLLFLDVEMPEVRGTTLAASLPEPRPFIVFATAYDHYAIEAFRCDATDYLLKPINRAKLAATLERVRSRRNRQSELEREVAVASALQAEMWPGVLPRVEGFDCAAACLPAHGVGGDFYDLLPLGGSSWAIVIGDVSGKGVPAGLVASSIQGRLQTESRMAPVDPAALVARLSQDVFQSTGGRRYATMIYAVLDASTARLTVVNAGHPPLLVLHERLHRIGSTGPAVGMVERSTFAIATLDLPLGSVLVAVTDGVTEALDQDDNELGDEGLAAAVTACRHQPAAGICATILAAVRAHRGDRQQQDDVTVLVIKSTAAGEPRAGNREPGAEAR